MGTTQTVTSVGALLSTDVSLLLLLMDFLQCYISRWLAPELLRGERATAASDVYAFGAFLGEKCGIQNADDRLVFVRGLFTCMTRGADS